LGTALIHANDRNLYSHSRQ